MKVLLINDTEEVIPEKFLNDWVKSMSKELSSRKMLPAERADKEISLVFLKEFDAKNLNWNFRQKDYPTDVLSFETEDPDSFGELVFCPPVLQKQAKENKKTYEEELGYMTLHGVLHLLGYDHEKDEEKGREMMRLQDDIFETLLNPSKKKAAPAFKAVAGPKVAAKASPKVAQKKKPSVKKALKKTNKK